MHLSVPAGGEALGSQPSSPDARPGGETQSAGGPTGVRVLVVEDDEQVRRVLGRVVERAGLAWEAAPDASSARELLRRVSFDAMLLDVRLPGHSGIELLSDLGEGPERPAVVVVSGIDDPELASQAIDRGVYGYLVKPFEPNEVLINLRNALRRRELEIEQARSRSELERRVRERTSELWDAINSLERADKQLRDAQEEIVRRLSMAAEFRDNEPRRHIQRMSGYCGVIMERLGHQPERVELVRLASEMHDIGKIGIPDAVLFKPGSLTPPERALMERHTELGYEILSGSGLELLDVAAQIALTHHEKYDGSGYPRGLSGEDIPLEGRVAAVADVFDALTTDRVYKKAVALGQALDIMRAGAGTHFDPRILDAFLDSLDEVLRIRSEHPDG